MKKHLILAIAAFLGLAASAAELPTGTQVTEASQFANDAIVALQCVSNSGGPFYYYNGAALKTPRLHYSNLYKVIVVEEGKFKLKRLSDDTYIGKGGNAFADATVANATDANAAIFSAEIGDTNDGMAPGVTHGVNTWRLKVTNAVQKMYLNTQAANSTPAFKGGEAGWSVWYAFTFSADEVTQVQNYVWEANITPGTPYIVKNIYKNLYLNGQQVDVPDASNASVSSVPSIIYFDQNPDNTKQFAIQVNNDDNGKYIHGNQLADENGWDTSMQDTPYYWSVAEQTGSPTQNGQVVRFTRTNSDTKNLVCNGSSNRNGTSVYDNQSASTNGTAWEIIPLSEVNIRDIATAAYQAMTGTTVGGASKYAYVPTTNEQLTALATVLNNNASTDADIIAALNGITLNEYNAWSANIQLTDGAIYTIASNELNSRGYLCINNGVLNSTKSTGAPSFSAESNNFRFVCVNDGENMYLYSLATEKFLNAFGTDCATGNDNFDDNVDHVWQISDHGTAITLNVYSGNARAASIQGGLEPEHHYNNYNNHPKAGGMTLVGNGGQTPNVLVTYGVTDNADGNGLVFNRVGELTADELAEIKAKLSANHSDLSSLISSIPSVDDGVTIINHYKGEIIPELTDKTPDHQSFLLQSADRHELTDGHVYSIENAEGKALRFTGTSDIVAADKEYEDGENLFHWQAVIADDNTVTFVHHDTGEQVQRATATVTLPEVSGTPDVSTVGKVGFNNQYYTLTQRGTSASEATTGISEISADSNAPATLYDLSGRRVVSPAKGIYVTSTGKKILVK